MIRRPFAPVAGSELPSALDLMSRKFFFCQSHVLRFFNVLLSSRKNGWIVVTLLPEMTNLEGKASFENVECSFPFTRCTGQESVEALLLWLKMAMRDPIQSVSLCGQKELVDEAGTWDMASKGCKKNYMRTGTTARSIRKKPG